MINELLDTPYLIKYNYIMTWVYAIIFFGIIIFFKGIRIINQYERGVKFRLGKFAGILQPGFRWIIPIIERIEKVDICLLYTSPSPRD